jgi:hypothetical protein
MQNMIDILLLHCLQKERGVISYFSLTYVGGNVTEFIINFILDPLLQCMVYCVLVMWSVYGGSTGTQMYDA